MHFPHVSHNCASIISYQSNRVQRTQFWFFRVARIRKRGGRAFVSHVSGLLFCGFTTLFASKSGCLTLGRRHEKRERRLLSIGENTARKTAERRQREPLLVPPTFEGERRGARKKEEKREEEEMRKRAGKRRQRPESDTVKHFALTSIVLRL